MVPVTELEIRNGNVPQCAMRVWRNGDLGALYSRAPAAPCACYFEFIATGATTCAPCSASVACPSSTVCRRG